ncbi:MAG: hypothetical protein JXB50_00215 [Spirochaetes bacterium]|nr:hypothetical protein [Spirochaetota bacterium]
MQSASAVNDNSDDLWIYNYINIDPSDDIYYGFRLKNYKIQKEYVENLKWNKDIRLHIDQFDEHNVRKNINALPRFPFVIMLYGGYSYNRAIDIGLLFRADNIANSGFAYTTAFSYGQKGYLWFHNNLEYPRFLNGRLKAMGTFSFFTSAPQYSANLLYYQAVSNYETDDNFEKLGLLIVRFMNKIFDKMNVTYNRQSDTGFHLTGGIDYRVPLFEMNIIPTLQLVYKYEDKRDVTDTGKILQLSYRDPPREKKIDTHNLGFNIGLMLKWDKFKETRTIPEGLYLMFASKFYIPTTLGAANGEFRFTTRWEAKYNKKLFREFAFKSRFLMALNYNISEDFSGDPYIRGMADYEMTGWFALLVNLEAFVPIVDVEMYSGLGKTFKRNANFIVFWTFFADCGFAIDNFNYYLKDFYKRSDRYQIRNSLEKFNIEGQKHIGNDNYLLPAATLGTGIHIQSFFLHFNIRADVAFNLIKVIVYSGGNYKSWKGLSGAEFVGLILAFSEMF